MHHTILMRTCAKDPASVVCTVVILTTLAEHNFEDTAQGNDHILRHIVLQRLELVLGFKFPNKIVTKLGVFATKMPSSAILHAACFAAGAVVGGGLVTAISSKRQISPPPSSVPTIDSGKSRIIIPPIVEIGATGEARITNAATAIALASPVLKYGNPGMRIQCISLGLPLSNCVNIGPISDALIRKAYVAGYDRRLRHPAWVSIFYFT
jgi:hypothetical protein